jgi:hypothetical protein
VHWFRKKRASSGIVHDVKIYVTPPYQAPGSASQADTCSCAISVEAILQVWGLGAADFASISHFGGFM